MVRIITIPLFTAQHTEMAIGHMQGVPFRIYNEQVEGTVPYYQYWNYKDHFYTTDYFSSGIDGYELNGILG